MPYSDPMTWDQNQPRWRRMLKGHMYRVSCAELGLPEKLWTESGSRASMRVWWEQNGSKQQRIMPISKMITDESQEQPLFDVGYSIDKMERLFNEEINLEEYNQSYIRDALPQKLAPKSMSVQFHIDSYMQLFKQKAPATVKELHSDLEWLGGLEDRLGLVMGLGSNVEGINKNTVRRMHDAVECCDLREGTSTRKKRWGFFVRFVGYLIREELTAPIANLHSPEYRFAGAETKEVVRISIVDIRDALAMMPSKCRAYAMLGLNCSMTNVDIGCLTKNMIVDGVLTRKRIKTKRISNVPVVSYKLWDETIEAIDKERSEDPMYWFVSRRKTAMYTWVTNKQGRPAKKDLVGKDYNRLLRGKKLIMLGKFRSVGTTYIRDIAGDAVAKLFLGHAPGGLLDKNYAASLQEKLNETLEQFRSMLYPRD